MSSSEEVECTHCHCLRTEQQEALELKESAIIEAIQENNIATLRTLLDSPELYNIRDECGYTLLQIAILRDFEDDAFDYLLALEDYPFDDVNERGETALMTSLCNSVRRILFNGDYFALKLIEKGADIHRVCEEGDTLLHCAFQKEYVDVATVLVEKGVDINRQNYDGNTPLHMCCMCCGDEELVEGVSMLLCFGADPTIRNRGGHTAFDYVITKSASHDVAVAAESLFYYLFDNYTEYDINAEILLKIAAVQSPFFDGVIKNIGTIFVNDSIKYRCKDLFIMKPKYLQVFIEKFDYVVKEILSKTTKTLTFYHDPSAENFYILIESKLQSEFIDWLCNIEINNVIIVTRHYTISESPLREVVCFLLSYGMIVNTRDFHIVFKKFGYCQLSKILLHMDMVEASPEYTKDVMPRLLYDLSTDVQKYIEEPLTLTVKDLRQILPYFAIPKLKNICSDTLQEHYGYGVMKKILNQPEIHLLVEMARNVFRRYFVEKLNIANAKQFYTQLNLLPISTYHKKIITLEEKLY